MRVKIDKHWFEVGTNCNKLMVELTKEDKWNRKTR